MPRAANEARGANEAFCSGLFGSMQLFAIWRSTFMSRKTQIHKRTQTDDWLMLRLCSEILVQLFKLQLADDWLCSAPLWLRLCSEISAT